MSSRCLPPRRPATRNPQLSSFIENLAAGTRFAQHLENVGIDVTTVAQSVAGLTAGDMMEEVRDTAGKVGGKARRLRTEAMRVQKVCDVKSGERAESHVLLLASYIDQLAVEIIVNTGFSGAKPNVHRDACTRHNYNKIPSPRNATAATHKRALCADFVNAHLNNGCVFFQELLDETGILPLLDDAGGGNGTSIASAVESLSGTLSAAAPGCGAGQSPFPLHKDSWERGVAVSTDPREGRSVEKPLGCAANGNFEEVDEVDVVMQVRFCGESGGDRGRELFARKLPC